MGRLSTLVVGVAIIGAGYAVTFLEEFIPEPREGGPTDIAELHGMLVEFGSIGLMLLGAAIAAYAILAMFFGFLRANWRRRKERKRREQAARQQQPVQGQAPQGQPGQQNPQGQGYGPQQQQPQNRQRDPYDQRRQQ